MAADPELAQLIGERIRRGRNDRGWTLDQLSDASGVSRRTVVNVEQGAPNPGIATLLRLSHALGIGLPALVGPRGTQATKVVRSDDGAVLWQGKYGGKGILVVGTEPPDVVELWDWTLGPSDRHWSEAHVGGTREIIQVIEGALKVVVGSKVYCLCPGDALTFSGDVEHSYVNHTDSFTRFSLVVFEPAEGAAHRTEMDGDTNDGTDNDSRGVLGAKHN